MTWLNEMRELGLSVTWGTLLVGWDGPGKCGRFVGPPEVIAQAENAVVGGDASREVIALSAAVPSESDEIHSILRGLVKSLGIDLKREERKWRALLLARALEQLPLKPTIALVELTSFWAGFDYPKDSPHTAQGIGNGISPTEYYTLANYAIELQRHRSWLEHELAELSAEGEPGIGENEKG